MLLSQYTVDERPGSEWIVLCDFDGTISVEDITDSLLERFGQPGWQEIEQAWKRGEIGSHDCMAQQVALLDASGEELDAHLDGMSIDRAFVHFAAAAREHFSALFVTHDLSEAVRVADRLLVLSEGGTGFVTERRIEGRPGERSDRAIFDLVETWSRDPAFAELFDGERKELS